jgi:hypothetical protein
MALLSIVLSVLTAIFVAVIDVQLESESLSGVQQDARFISGKLYYDINSATSVTQPALGTTTSNLQFTRNGINYEYSLNGSDLVITDMTGTYPVNSYSTSVSNVSFTRLGNSGGKHIIQITLTVTSDVLDVGETETKVIQTSVGLR